MKQEIVSYVSKQTISLLMQFTIIIFGACIPMLCFLISASAIGLAIFTSISALFILFLTYFLPRKKLLYTCISNAAIVSKLYGFEKCALLWEDVKYIAVFQGIDRGRYSSILAPYILLSSDDIDEKHCCLASYKPKKQIAVRITPKNADTILSIVNEKLGLSLSYEQLLEVEIGEPVILDLSDR